jgi:beta-fructofuranosidase
MTTDTAFPALHVRPATGWVNDPNGPFRWKGRYHLFYQHNPAAPVHAQIAWGHSSSVDLLHWETGPVAFTPTPGHLDAGGCWSGCVVDDSGVPTAVYTGIGDSVLDASVCLATADDDELRSWSKHPTAAARPPAGLDLIGYRDPFVFTVDGRRYALVGAGLTGGGAATVLLYACDNLREWTYLGPLLDTGDAVAKTHAPADIWECPQLVRLADRWVLIVSLWTDEVLGRVAYLVGDLDVSGGVPHFNPTGGGLVDSGRDFYAPAVLTAPDRTLMWAWSWEDRSEPDVLASGWAGAMTLPRELTLDPTGRLVTAPARELHALRGTATTQVLTTRESLLLPSGPLDIEIRLHVPPDRLATLVLAVDDDELTVTVEPATGQVDLRRQVHHADRTARAAAGRIAPNTNMVDVRLLLDGSIVELFLPDGVVFTERLYPAPTPHHTVLHFQGATGTQAVVTAWRLRTPGAR